MITINHGLSAYVCGRVAMPVLRKHSPVSERALGWSLFLGGSMPDADILTKIVLGREEYFSGTWYAHRAASHSLLGTLLMALAVAALCTLACFGRRRGAREGFAVYSWLVGALWVGGLIHLFADMFTPGWPLALFWPGDGKYGSYSHIGWFTPYLLWLFVASLLAAAALQLLGRWRPNLRRHLGAAAWVLYATATWRWVHFVLTSSYESRGQWADYQRDLLPDAMIAPINRAVSMAWHWLTG